MEALNMCDLKFKNFAKFFLRITKISPIFKDAEVLARLPNCGRANFFFLLLYFYRRATPEGLILAGYYGLNPNISFRFKAMKNLSAHHTYGLCIFLGGG